MSGELTIPAVELPWFNVIDEVWEVARVEPRGVTVLDSAETVVGPPAAPAAADAPASAAVAGNARFWQGVSAGLLAGWILTGALFLRSARSRAPAVRRRPARAARPASRRRLLREIRAACAANDSEQARDLLLQWGALQLPEAPKTLGHLAAEVSEALAAAVTDLEESLYGPTPSDWNGATLSEALARADAAGRSSESAPSPNLTPLYR